MGFFDGNTSFGLPVSNSVGLNMYKGPQSLWNGGKGLMSSANGSTKGLFEQLLSDDSFLGKIGALGESNVGKGLSSILSLGSGIMDGYNNYRGFKENMKNMKLMRESARYDLDRKKSENARLDRQRQQVTNAYTNNRVR